MTPGPGAALLESDRRYFELGAVIDEVDGAHVAWIPGMEAMPAGCVVHRVRPEAIGSGDRDDARVARWVGDVTVRLRDLGCSVARIYLDGPAPVLDAALAAAGFRPRVEIGFVVEGVLAAGGARRGDLSEVVDEDGWEAKRKLHAGSDVAADGHATTPDEWVDFERRKCETGGMRAFLVAGDGEPCGCVATLEVDGLLRVKNLFVHADRRREGIAAETVRLLSRRAASLGLAATGTFGIHGKPGAALYRSLGLTPVVEQTEWALPL